MIHTTAREIKMVGAAGVEPATFCSQSRRASHCAMPRHIQSCFNKIPRRSGLFNRPCVIFLLPDGISGAGCFRTVFVFSSGAVYINCDRYPERQIQGLRRPECIIWNIGEIMNIRFSLLSVTAVMLAMFSAGCEENPADVAKNWHSAIMSGDLEKANSYVVATKEAKAGNEMWLEIINALRKRSAADPEAKNALKKAEKAKFAQTAVEDDRATVVISVKGEEATARILLRKIDGAWKIADIK